VQTSGLYSYIMGCIPCSPNHHPDKIILYEPGHCN
jgi:hypothetical protein